MGTLTPVLHRASPLAVRLTSAAENSGHLSEVYLHSPPPKELCTCVVVTLTLGELLLHEWERLTVFGDCNDVE